MTDFYNLMFGRPSPGMARRVGQVASRTEYEGESVMPPEWAPRLSERGRYEGSGGRPVVPVVVGPGGVTDDPPPAERVSVRDVNRPADFVEFARPRNLRPLPDALVAREAEPPPRFAWGEDTMGGEARREPYALPDNPPAGMEPADAEVAPRFDPTQEWAAAEMRAGATQTDAEAAADRRWREGRPSQTDMLFALIFGRRGAQAPRSREESQSR